VLQMRITSESLRSSPATSPPTEAIPLSAISCAAAQTHARPGRTNASPREPQPSYRSMNMGSPGEKYHILSRDGVDRGGVTGHLPVGAPPHWLPYVAVDDVDATIARARN